MALEPGGGGTAGSAIVVQMLELNETDQRRPQPRNVSRKENRTKLEGVT
jgi:hypothetical protein